MTRRERRSAERDASEPPEPAAWSHNLRCLHTEYGRPPSDQDAAAGERHWRCPAWFRFVSYVEDKDLPIGDRASCAAHRHLYLPGEPTGPDRTRQAETLAADVAERWIFPEGS